MNWESVWFDQPFSQKNGGKSQLHNDPPSPILHSVRQYSFQSGVVEGVELRAKDSIVLPDWGCVCEAVWTFEFSLGVPPELSFITDWCVHGLQPGSATFPRSQNVLQTVSRSNLSAGILDRTMHVHDVWPRMNVQFFWNCILKSRERNLT